MESITWPDGSAFDENASYTVAMDRGGYTDEIGEKGEAHETELVVIDVVGEYLREHSPVSPLKHSIQPEPPA